MKTPVKRIIAFIIDYFIWMILYGVFLWFLVDYDMLGEQIESILWIVLLLVMLSKDSIGGASPGKRLMGLTVRRYSQRWVPHGLGSSDKLSHQGL